MTEGSRPTPVAVSGGSSQPDRFEDGGFNALAIGRGAKTRRKGAFSAALDYAVARPASLVACLSVLQVVVWTAAPTLLHGAPPLDVVEGYLWGREGVILSHKHPNLPGLLLEASYWATGAFGWPAYLLSQLFAAATYLFVYLLGRDLMGAKAAAAGTLLLAGCFYFSWPLPEFNHNVAQMPFWAAFAYGLWKAVERDTLPLWILLALIAALGLYAKFSTAVLLATGALWLLTDPRGRACLRGRGPWLGLAVFIGALAPLAAALKRSQFTPFAYAADRSIESASNFPSFVGAQLADIAGMAVILAAAFLLPRARATRAPIEERATELSPRARRYLLALALAPIGLTALVALASGANPMWGMPMFDLAGLLMIMPLRRRLDGVVLRRVAVAALTIFLLAPAAYAATLLAAPRFGPPRPPLRALWPQAAIAERMGGIWARTIRSPLRIVGGDCWVAGLVALTAPDLPSVYDNRNAFAAPWITAERVARQGLLVVWEERGKGPPDAWRATIAGHAVGEEDIRWSSSEKQPPLRVGYAIIPPTAE